MNRYPQSISGENSIQFSTQKITHHFGRSNGKVINSTINKSSLIHNSNLIDKKYRLLQKLEGLENKLKFATMQKIKKYIDLLDCSQYSIKTPSVYDHHIFFGEEQFHSLQKILQTQYLERIMWAFLNIKFWKIYKKVANFTHNVNKVILKKQKQHKKIGFQLIDQYSLKIFAVIRQQSQHQRINTSKISHVNCSPQIQGCQHVKSYQYLSNITNTNLPSSASIHHYHHYHQLYNHGNCSHQHHHHNHCHNNHCHNNHCHHCRYYHHHQFSNELNSQYNLEDRIAYLKHLESLMDIQIKNKDSRTAVSNFEYKI